MISGRTFPHPRLSLELDTCKSCMYTGHTISRFFSSYNDFLNRYLWEFSSVEKQTGWNVHRCSVISVIKLHYQKASTNSVSCCNRLMILLLCELLSNLFFLCLHSCLEKSTSLAETLFSIWKDEINCVLDPAFSSCRTSNCSNTRYYILNEWIFFCCHSVETGLCCHQPLRKHVHTHEGSTKRFSSR